MARPVMSKPRRQHVRTPSPEAIPPPFEPVPDSMLPFLESLPPKHVFITHLDNHPRAFKQQIFAIPVVLNLTIFLLLSWRVYCAVPWYLTLVHDLWIRPSSPFLSEAGWKHMVGAFLFRTVIFIFDYALAVVVAPWPYTFFLEWPSNPTLWRWSIGFQDRELIVRKSRGWGVDDLLLGEKRGGSSPFWATRVLPAIDMENKIGKTGYLLTDESWDLEFAGMARGQKVIADRTNEWLFNGRVWAYIPTQGNRKGQWVMWDFSQQYGRKPPSKYRTYGGDKASMGEDQMQQEIQRIQRGEDENHNDTQAMILKFRDKLTEMDKEDLFFRWVECIQYESSQPGGFTFERQKRAGERVKALFHENGVDFDKFTEEVGIQVKRSVDEVD